MSALLTQLMRFVSSEEKWHAAPFSLKTKKETWSIATDNHILLAVKAPGVTPGKDYPKELKLIISKPAVSPVEINLEELKKWAGGPPNLKPLGEVAFKHQGVLLDHIIDKRKLAFLFATITAPTVHAWVIKPGMLAFEQPGKKWRAFLAGCKDKPDGEEPVFQTDKSLSALELAELVGEEATK